ncbi:GrpB family protein [Agrobacterium vitis]|uniref:GrpB family protein n=1 Tax=Agrobacterium vitis TaxID=373 RepID=UPI0012E870B6|nr:GrpB family protein [Agrobacterium vitis]MVA80670.1 GrpB family protein [Agrobacterium vitis]
MLGLKHNVNLLVDYHPQWDNEFAQEKQRLSIALGSIAHGIEHYGSTAVKGMKAKPILDILIGVAPLSDWKKCEAPLLELGYDYAANAGVPGHHIFGKGRDQTERTHLVHVVEYMGESWCSNLAFRDALRRDPLLRDAYVAEKQQAIALSPASRTEYNTLKQTFIDSVKASL